VPPGLDLKQIQKELAGESLRDFIRIGWPQIDKSSFVPGFHIDAICDHLEAVTRGEITRLLINIPPRHMKSSGVCVAWPAWIWAQEPNEEGDYPTKGFWGPSVQFLYASYAQSLSNRDSAKCRRLMRSPWYRRNWGHLFEFSGDQNAKIRFENDQMGYRIATSVDGLATGEGGDIVVVDDPHNTKQAESETVREACLTWWDETMSTRLNDPRTGAFVIIMQRLHENDLTGHILETEGADWTHLCLPARFEPDHPTVWARDPRTELGQLLWPVRVPETTMVKLERRLGPYAVAGQLQQRPAPREGGLFKHEYFEHAMIDRANLPQGRVRVRHWDLAATELKATDMRGARTAGVLMSRSMDGRYFVEDCRTAAKGGNAVKKLIHEVAVLEDGKGVTISLPQDPGQAGKTQRRDFMVLLDGFVVRSSLEGAEGSKEKRAEPFATQCEAGNVYLVKAPWNKEFLDEITMFPGGVRKDIVDACSGAYTKLVPHPAMLIGQQPIVGGILIEGVKEVEGYMEQDFLNAMS
jgi:predicted phage terminase large subunit-like protein